MSRNEFLDELVALSHEYGRDTDWVVAGGGNSSLKNRQSMWIKASGFPMATISAEQFVCMDRDRLDAIWQCHYPQARQTREQMAKDDLLNARAPGQQDKRPSVEALMHSLFPHRIVFHTHPTLINGLTCATDGERIAGELFGDEMIWIPMIDPGYVLGTRIRTELERYRQRHSENYPVLLLLQNHGLVVYGDNVETIHQRHRYIVERITQRIERRITPPASRHEAEGASPALDLAAQQAMRLLAEHGYTHWATDNDPAYAPFLRSRQTFAVLNRPLTPDQIVYIGHRPAWAESETPKALADAIEHYCHTEQVPPKVIAIAGKGIITLGRSAQLARNAVLMFRDTTRIIEYARSIGTIQPLSDDQVDFIRNWEVEQYRVQVSPMHQ